MTDSHIVSPRPRCTRRAAIAAPLALIAASLLPAATIESTQSVPGNECAAAPGVQLLIDLGRGLPVMSPADLAIPAGWAAFFDQQLGIGYYHPAEWDIVRLWADQLTAGGAPVWQTAQPPVPSLLSARAVAPSGDAAFETVIASFPNLPISPAQGAVLARLGVTGDGVTAQPICSFAAPAAFGYDWVDATFAGGATVMTMGVLRSSPDPLNSSSALVWHSLVAPIAQFEARVREVFARILIAMIPGREVVNTPTPTP